MRVNGGGINADGNGYIIEVNAGLVVVITPAKDTEVLTGNWYRLSLLSDAFKSQ